MNVKFNKLTKSVNALNINPSGAAKVDKSQYCSLCTGRGDKVQTHSTYNCSVYPNPSSKKEKLQSLNGCLKCGNLSHDTRSYRFKFVKKCISCGRFHSSYLCTRNELTVKVLQILVISG